MGLFPFQDEVTDFLVEKIGREVKRQVEYLIYYERNYTDLTQEIGILEERRQRVVNLVAGAEADDEGIHGEVKGWLTKADGIITETKKFPVDKGRARTGCSSGLLPFLWHRNQLSQKATTMAGESVQLRDSEQKFGNNVFYQKGLSAAALFSTSYESIGSRDETMNKIETALKDPNVKMIGVYGLGGVGKSTLVKEAARKATEGKLFDSVAMATVTRNPDPKTIQAQLADILGLKFKEETETGRAARLLQRLTKDKEKNILVILDDIWTRIDLATIGIPFRDDNKRCKILLVSRDKGVLSKMDVRDNSSFPLGVLSQTEGEKLFKKIIHHDNPSQQVQKSSAENAKFAKLVTKFVEKCEGFPVGIITVASSLKNKSFPEWEVTLQQLESGDSRHLTEAVDRSIKIGYDNLESEELRSIFLLCAQMGQDPLIKDLVRYCMGLGLTQRTYSLKEAHDKVDKSIAKLKSLGLLIDSYSNDRFSMHDTVRDVAMLIASKDYNVLTLRNSKLNGWPDKDDLRNCTVISLGNSDIGDELPEGLVCPRLKLFHIHNKDPSLRIPDNFFEGMSELKVLVLTYFDLTPLPSSVKCLKALRMLCLEECELGDISFIANLKNLRILSLSGSQIKELPRQIGELGQLQLLDLSNCYKLDVLPRNIISCLKNLQELYLDNSFHQWEAEEQMNENHNASLAEIKHLHQLRALEIHISDATILPRNLFFDKLERYKILIGDAWSWSYVAEKRALQLDLSGSTNVNNLLRGVKVLFKTVEVLSLGELNGIKNVIYELNWEVFPRLKYLLVEENDQIEYVISSEEWLKSRDAFPSLESLYLFNLRNLQKIYNGQYTVGSFCKLSSITVRNCNQLKNLFSSSMVTNLAKLQTIEVSECDSLEEIVVLERDGITDSLPEAANSIKFPEMLSLTLQSLTALIGFHTNRKSSFISQTTDQKQPTQDLDHVPTIATVGSSASSFPVFGDNVEFPKLESLELSSINLIQKIWNDQPLRRSCFPTLRVLTVDGCDNLGYLFSVSMAASLSNLEYLSIKGCTMMREIILTTDDNMNNKVDVFPKLATMMLEGMENLNSIWPQQLSSDSFTKLDYMIIDGCNKLVTVLPFHMLGKFQNLNLTVGNCGSVEYIFDLQADDRSKYKHGVIGKKKKHIPRVVDAMIQFIDLEKLPKLKHIWSKDPQGIFSFKNVQTVSVCECKTLKSVFPASVATSLAQLGNLYVKGCSLMEEIVASRESEGSEPSNDILAFNYPQLTNLYLDSLPELKSFYPGKHTLQTTKMLTSFGVLSCDKLEAFPAETTSQDQRQPISNKQPILSSVKEVIPYLEELILSGKDANLILHGKYPMDTFRNLTELWVHDMGNSGDEFPYWSLHRIPNLKTLTLQLSPFKGVFPNGSLPAHETQIGTDVQLTKLQLLALSELEFICKEGFQLDPVLQMLEYLEIEGCSSLINLVPFSASFSHLTFLQVENCSKLEYLVASSTARSLVQLTRMIISNCQMIEEIISKVSKEADERDQNHEIVFSQLKTLELLDLPILGSFCSSDLVFKFPSLENLTVSQCPKMKIFSMGVITAPKLWKLLVEKKETEEEGESFWAVDLNTTIENLFTNKVAEIAQVAKLVCESEQLNLVSHPELKELWHGDTPLPDKCFSNLKTLVVDKCELLPNSIAIPSNLLPFLNNLEELKVQNCKLVEVIFDVKGLEVTDEGTISFGLKKLILDQLPKLKHVWNKDPQGILSFQSFQKVIVSKCKSLKCLFPSSVAKCLMKLGKLDIRDCGLEEIVEKDEDENEEATKKFVFRRLITLRLWNLQKLKNFYPGRHTLDWWMLKDLDIYDCNGFEMLTSEFQSYREAHPLGQLDIPIYRQPLSFVLKVFPNLEKLSFVRCYFKEILSSEISHDVAHRILARLKELAVFECSDLENLVPSSVSFSNLTNLKVHNCHGLENLFTYSTGKSLVQLKVMDISDCRKMKEIVSAEGDDHQSEYKIIFRNLNSLKLVRLPGLATFFTGPSSLRFPSLELLTVIECPQLKRFCEGIISAPKLKEIQVADTTVKKYIKENFVQDIDPQYSEEEENNNEENEVDNVKGVPGKYLGWFILW